MFVNNTTTKPRTRGCLSNNSDRRDRRAAKSKSKSIAELSLASLRLLVARNGRIVGTGFYFGGRGYLIRKKDVCIFIPPSRSPEPTFFLSFLNDRIRFPGSRDREATLRSYYAGIVGTSRQLFGGNTVATVSATEVICAVDFLCFQVVRK